MTWIFVAAVLSAATGQPTFDEFFADFAQKRDAIQLLRAEFVQENHTPEEVVRAQGHIVYARPRQIMFTYERPNPGLTYLIDGQKAYEYQPDAKQLEIRGIKDSPETEAFFLGFSNNTQALREAYDLALFDTDGPPLAKCGIIIRPKKDAETVPFQEVRLFLRESDYLPVRILVVNDAESEVRIQITSFDVNPSKDTVKVQLDLPGGTKVIEDDQVQEVVGPKGKVMPDVSVGSAVETAPAVTTVPLAPPPSKTIPEAGGK